MFFRNPRQFLAVTVVAGNSERTRSPTSSSPNKGDMSAVFVPAGAAASAAGVGVGGDNKSITAAPASASSSSASSSGDVGGVSAPGADVDDDGVVLRVAEGGTVPAGGSRRTSTHRQDEATASRELRDLSEECKRSTCSSSSCCCCTNTGGGEIDPETAVPPPGVVPSSKSIASIASDGDDDGCRSRGSNATGGGGSSREPGSKPPLHASRAWAFSLLVFLSGCAASGIMLVLNVPALKNEQQASFVRLSGELLRKFGAAVDSYNDTALWIHQAVSYAMNVSHDERPGFEATTRGFVETIHPNVTYRGFSGFEPDPEVPGGFKPGPRSNASFYFPVHYVEPLESAKNMAALDFDIYTSGSRRAGVDQAISTGKAALTERLKLIKESEDGTDPAAYSVIMFHPGTSVSGYDDDVRNGLAVLAIRIPELLVRANVIGSSNRNGPVYMFIFDSTDDDKEEPPFLGGALYDECLTKDGDRATMELTQEFNLSGVRAMKANYYTESSFPVASREWTFVVLAPEGSFDPDLTFVLLGAIMILLFCTSLAFWIWISARRMARMNALRSKAEAEKAQLMVDNAKRAARDERELNDFIAHEVRNPLAAAISACSFVSMSINESVPLVDEDSRKSVREDMNIIDNSLQFVNDLLRNMLDLHRASSNQLKVELQPVDLLPDVLQPVASMIYCRGDDFKVEIDCPPHTVIMCDRLRLKQVMLNLARNSAKFVSAGFVRLRVEIVDEKVNLFVEDSGPGIPIQKQKRLFAKFQESLDSLSQGTGIGLCLCKNLVELMGGSIYLDENFHSGLENCPGTRFVIGLNAPLLQMESLDLFPHEKEVDLENGMSTVNVKAALSSSTWLGELPSQQSVLFVDDSFVLRKLFGRALKRIAPDWTVEEAASGESALRMVEKSSYDLIFVDQYMASADKQLLGTETIRLMRTRGIEAIICGLSANDLENVFVNAGADAFMIKPFPCEPQDLSRELLRIVNAPDRAVANTLASA